MGIFFGDRQISYHLNVSRKVYSRNKNTFLVMQSYLVVKENFSGN